jgi:hypothetical protein
LARTKVSHQADRIVRHQIVYTAFGEYHFWRGRLLRRIAKLDSLGSCGLAFSYDSRRRSSRIRWRGWLALIAGPGSLSLIRILRAGSTGYETFSAKPNQQKTNKADRPSA